MLNEYLPERKWLRNIVYLIIIYWLFGCIVIIYRYLNPVKEEFKMRTKIKVRTAIDEIYDEFYVDIYDTLFHSEVKFEYEVVQTHGIIKKWIEHSNKGNKSNKLGTSDIRILDVGCGTGKHLKYLKRFGYQKMVGLDISKHMTTKSKRVNPMDEIILGNFNNNTTFIPNSFTHITCFFFTIYYATDFDTFFKNMNTWLKDNGLLIVHIVHRDKFDPILDRASSAIPLFNPQKHIKTRKTETDIVFNKFKYNTKWDFSQSDVTFNEIFKFKDGSKTLKNVHTFFMPSRKQIVKFANRNGFELKTIVDQLIVGFEHNYLYCFEKKM